MDTYSVSITCRNCKKTFSMKGMVQHSTLAKQCKGTYTEDQVSNIRKHLEELTRAKKRIKEYEKFLKMDKGLITITCRRCERTFPLCNIVQHVDKSGCRPTYSDMQLSSLKAHSNEISDAKQKIKRAQKYSANKSEMLSKKNE